MLPLAARRQNQLGLSCLSDWNKVGALEVDIACIACLLTYKPTQSYGTANISYMYIAVTLFHCLYVKFIIQCYLSNIEMWFVGR